MDGVAMDLTLLALFFLLGAAIGTIVRPRWAFIFPVILVLLWRGSKTNRDWAVADDAFLWLMLLPSTTGVIVGVVVGQRIVSRA